MNGELIRLRLEPEREKQLISYVKDRRYSFMITFGLAVIITVVLTPLAIIDFNEMVDNFSGGFFTDSAEHGSQIPILMSLARRYRSSYIGDLFIFWIGAALLSVLGFIFGFGRIFGPGSDYHCLINQRYGFGTMIVGGKQPDCTKHPYYINDREGNSCICPVFLEYRNAKIGDEMFCVVLDNGTRFAMETKKKPWQDSE